MIYWEDEGSRCDYKIRGAMKGFLFLVIKVLFFLCFINLSYISPSHSENQIGMITGEILCNKN